MLYNGYGEHGIQGIGDKHIPLIHNVTNTDMVVGISDQSTDALDVLFNSEAGRRHLVERGVPEAVAATLVDFGYSSICNTLAAITAAKEWDLGPDDVIVTVATDGSELYDSDRERVLATRYPGGFGEADAVVAFDANLGSVDTVHARQLDTIERDRIFNLGYFTWVEQQGVSVADFDRRRDQAFWSGLRPLVDRWDEMIGEFNAATGAAVA